MKLKVLVAAAALGVAGQAHALIDHATTEGFDNLGGNELMFTVFDTATGDSYTRDLGIKFNDINSSSSYSFAADGNLNSLLGSSDLVWSVTAADFHEQGSSLNPVDFGYRMLTTSTVAAPAVFDEFKFRQAGAKIRDLGASLNNLNEHVIVANGSSIVNGAAPSWANVGATLGSNAPFSVQGNVGDSLSFLAFKEDGAVQDLGFAKFWNVSEVLFQELLGDWTMAANGTLTFNGAAAAVPVPAAVWLFGSAILGFAGYNRRKAA